MLSKSVEDYLKAIYEIQNMEGKVTTNSLSQKLNVTPASVTGMMRRLSSQKLITYKKYQGVKLAPMGQKIALEVIRHHRIVELYLKEALGVTWDKVHEEAEKLEHVISEDIEDKMDEFLGHPTSDPHGSPIPGKNGEVIERKCMRLTEVEPRHTAVVAEVSDHDPRILKYLGKLGFYPQTKIKVDSVEPFNGPMKIEINNKVEFLGAEVAKHIAVTKIEKIV